MSGELASNARSLPNAVANELAAALTATVAQLTESRVLLVKGVVASHHRLRPVRVSADIDVLIEPGRFSNVVNALRAAGWVERPETEAATLLAAHSVTLIHPKWPTDIDAHHFFPGFLAGSTAAFDVLWSERREIERGGVSCAMAGPLGSTLIAGLHSIRHDGLDQRHLSELQWASTVVAGWPDADQDALARLAEATGAAGPLADWFGALGIKVDVAPSAALTDWRTKRHSGDTFAGQLVAGVAGARWRDRPRLLWIAFWPSATQLRAVHPEIGPRRRHLVRARLDRWGRGLHDTPAAARAFQRARKEAKG